MIHYTQFTGTIQLIFVKSNFWKVRHDSLQTVYRYNTADPEGELKKCHGFETVSTY